MSSIVSIGAAVPAHEYEQTEIARYMAATLQSRGFEKTNKLMALYGRTGIQTRYSVLPDFQMTVEMPALFTANTGAGEPTVQERMAIYMREAAPLARTAAEECLQEAQSQGKSAPTADDVTHLITVSCTGMSAPGLEIELAEKLGLQADVQHFAVNFMGCYAAFHALKLADYICRAASDAIVLVVCVELCTIHFQKGMDWDSLVANALFADGAAAALVMSDTQAARCVARRLRMDTFDARVLREGKRDMAWEISSTGFLMTLSSYIPDLVNDGIGPLLRNALDRSNIRESEVAYWAIHPGGRKILDTCVASLAIDKDALLHSYQILAKYGNMSSPTILFVLHALWRESLDWGIDKKIFAAGFGPGLTLESAVLTAQISK